jgi:XTP/dITP diphosphohydrolase
MRVVLATNNQHKLLEFQQILEPWGYQLTTPAELQVDLDVDEVGETFASNAVLKAVAWSLRTGLPALADDSGLEVDALNGEPGVHSARYAGEPRSDARNNARLVSELQARGLTSSPARYRCCIAFAGLALDGTTADWSPRLAAPFEGLVQGVRVAVVDGTFEGHVSTTARGQGGFGYDPWFVVPDGRHLAELSSDEKHRISHRGHALRRLQARLQ